MVMNRKHINDAMSLIKKYEDKFQIKDPSDRRKIEELYDIFFYTKYFHIKYLLGELVLLSRRSAANKVPVIIRRLSDLQTISESDLKYIKNLHGYLHRNKPNTPYLSELKKVIYTTKVANNTSRASTSRRNTVNNNVNTSRASTRVNLSGLLNRANVLMTEVNNLKEISENMRSQFQGQLNKIKKLPRFKQISNRISNVINKFSVRRVRSNGKVVYVPQMTNDEFMSMLLTNEILNGYD